MNNNFFVKKNNNFGEKKDSKHFLEPEITRSKYRSDLSSKSYIPYVYQPYSHVIHNNIIFPGPRSGEDTTRR